MTPDDVQRALVLAWSACVETASEIFLVPPEVVTGRRRHQGAVMARQAAQFWYMRLTKSTANSARHVCGMRSHGALLWSIRQTEAAQQNGFGEEIAEGIRRLTPRLRDLGFFPPK